MDSPFNQFFISGALSIAAGTKTTKECLLVEALVTGVQEGLPSHLCNCDKLLLGTQGKIVELCWILRENICVFECSVLLHVKCALASEAGKAKLSATSS